MAKFIRFLLSFVVAFVRFALRLSLAFVLFAIGFIGGLVAMFINEHKVVMRSSFFARK